ncbi:protein SCO1/2 [Caulobacter ginsengisoli]|uniref:Protein SCO1/2 n=1 Tax=Caulobacter ginsengisoli TaxID=400775 RepID=A0ABU0IUJ9_9CAUL|nr:SCO family protein [Caulobacter ginsengisoli]MDQ0465687.1 protein SCO1/2 [Caulobacter ginsengisoli]
MNRSRWFLLGFMVFALLASVGYYLTASRGDPKSAGDGPGGPFQLVDQNGAQVTEAALKGHWSVVFFGYTYCPDICPGTLQNLALVKDRLGPKGRDLKIVFISVDPARDTAAHNKEWLAVQGAPPGTLALTGSDQQVAQAAKAYKVYYQKAGDGLNYSVNHSSVVYLMDPKGRFNRVLVYNLPDEMVTQIQKGMRGE